MVKFGLQQNICNGLRPEFGKGTPEIYKKLAHICMNSDSNERPAADKLCDILNFWYDSFWLLRGHDNIKKIIIKDIFEEADKETPSISTLYKKNTDTTNTSSKEFEFNNLPNPVNLFHILI